MRYLIIIIAYSLLACGPESSTKHESTTDYSIRIMFGSCAHEDEPQPLLEIAAGFEPDVFVFLGDNIYGDTRDMDVLSAKYAKFAAKPGLQQLKANSTVFAVWDDHDYGENDAGRHYPMKAESKEVFLEFWDVPEDSDRRAHEGIYGVEYFEEDGFKVQFILLDTRTFRDELRHRTDMDTAFKNDYVPYETTDSTFLGEAQWTWLESVLRQPADLRVVASSNQFSHEYNGWESWTNVPHERQRFIDLIKSTKAEHLLFISGDVHWGEISRQDVHGGYPLYDVTSSGITQTWPDTEPNENRVGEVIRQNNVGVIDVMWNSRDTTLKMGLVDSTEAVVEGHTIALSDLTFDR